MRTDPDIFLSYARENRKTAKRLAEALAGSRGWSVWWDVRLRSGERFVREIQRVVAQARCVIVLWSHYSADSDWVAAEVSEGWERGVLVPILIDDCKPPMPFRQTQSANFIDWNGSTSSTAFLALLEDVQRVMARGSAVSPEVLAERNARRRQIRRRRWRRPLGLVGAVAALAALTWAGLQMRGDADRAKAVAARSGEMREALLSAHKESKRKWWAFLVKSGDHFRQAETIALLAAEAFNIAETPESEAAVAEAWALLPWTDKSQEFPWADWHSSLDFSHDGELVAAGGGENGTVIWNLAEDKILARIPHGGLLPKQQRQSSASHRGPGILDFSPVERLLATAGPDDTVRLWNDRGEQVRRLDHEHAVSNVQFGSLGKLLAATDTGGAVVLWNVAAGTEERRMRHAAAAKAPVFSSSGKLLGTVDAAGIASVWQVATGEMVASFSHEVDWRGSTVNGIAFSPDEKTAVTYGSILDTVFYDIASATEVWRVRANTWAGVVFSADSETVVIGTNDLAWWNTRTHALKFSVPDAAISAIAISPDRQLIVTANVGDAVQVWDSNDGREVKRIPTYRWQPSVAIAPDSETLAISGFDEFRGVRSLEAINVRPANLMEKLCSGVSVNFSHNEWREYFPGETYRATCPKLEVADSATQ